ncbi:hypothetical protein ACEUDG_05650 [Aeromonas rivipollensis]|uniref:hypothetical protein n=1 Tax=Aeromonas rivipollensis TaxID=948519 RepID=UPI0038D09722
MNNNQLLNLISDIERCIDSLGVMYRIFYREKSSHSLSEKINKDPEKYNANKKIQDIIGVRVALYFVDDIDVVRNALQEKFQFIPEDSQIDNPTVETFSATRCNLVFRLPDSFSISEIVEARHQAIIDNTFELQLRTILSEGWHEVDHDLRFKCKGDWIGLDKENRAFNGVYATLETSEWTLLKLFEELSYTHYKNKNVKAMLINKLRLRLKPSNKDDEVLEYLKVNEKLIKQIFRYDRDSILKHLSTRPKLPLSISNIIFIMNVDSFNDHGLNEMTPSLLRNWWESSSI